MIALVRPKVTVPNGLVGYWPFDEESITPTLALDATPFKNNGTLSGATKPVLCPGKIRSALSFDGASSCISLPALGLSGSMARSISAWIYPTSSAAGAVYASGAVAQYQLFEVVFNQTVANNIYIVGNNSDCYTGANTIPLNAWSHVLVTYSGGAVLSSGSVCIYINGVAQVLTNAGAQAQILNTANSNYQIGSRAGTSEFFPGRIDDFRPYNRALAPWEDIAIYKSGFAYGRP